VQIHVYSVNQAPELVHIKRKSLAQSGASWKTGCSHKGYNASWLSGWYFSFFPFWPDDDQGYTRGHRFLII
jgi:hypothetical protein